MVEVAAKHGYAAATIARVTVRAGVSRPTFYEYFTDKDDCFLEAQAAVHERVLATVAQAVGNCPPEHATAAAIEALIELADTQPSLARFAMAETLAGGPRALDARSRAIYELARVIEHASAQLGPGATLPDLPVPIMLGAVQRLLGARLRGPAGMPTGMLTELLDWIRSYDQPASEHRWRALTPHTTPPLPPGRSHLSERQVSEDPRQRILLATAEVVRHTGYAAATVATIVGLADVDKREFHRLFTGKPEAFAALHELAFQRTMAVTAGAFFAAGDWPERIWEAGRAFTQFNEHNPSLTYPSLLEGHAGDSSTVQRLEDLIGAFTIFLQEGYHYGDTVHAPSALALEAIAAANFEIVQSQARGSGAEPELSGLIAMLSYVCLAPFLGVGAANVAVDSMIAGEGAGTS